MKFLLVIFCILLLSCSEKRHHSFEIQLSPLPDNYHITLYTTEKSTHTHSCPRKNEVITCTEKGFSTKKQPVSVTIRANGFERNTTLFSQNTEPAITLSPLHDFKKTDSYATGFYIDEQQLFKDLASKHSGDLGTTWLLKFYVELTPEPSLYLIDSEKYPLHYDFAVSELNFSGDQYDFADKVYYTKQKTVAAGTILLYSSIDSELLEPYALSFFPSDAITPEDVLKIHAVIESRLQFLAFEGRENRFIYLPVGENHHNDALSMQETFQMQGVLMFSMEELYISLDVQLLNPGKAVGKLRYIEGMLTSDEVLGFEDIVILERLPNNLPLVGGTITHQLQTPLAHVNIMARNRKTPNMALKNAADHPDIKPLIGEIVSFTIDENGWHLEKASLQDLEEFLNSRKGEKQSASFDLEEKRILSLKEISFPMKDSFGVKARNLAVISQVIPHYAPAGCAIPFYYYDTFMKQSQLSESLCNASNENCIEEGRNIDLCTTTHTICKAFSGSLQELTSFNMLLSGIKSLFEN